MKIFYDANTNGLNDQDSGRASYYRIIKYRDGNIYGPVTTYFISGKPYIVANYTGNNTSKGFENGKYIKYYENGNVFLSCNYIKGVLDGVFIEFYPSGSKKASVTFSKGARYGCEYAWDGNGRLTHKAFIENGISYARSECDTIDKTKEVGSVNTVGVTDYYNGLFPYGKYNAVNFSHSSTILSYKSNSAMITGAGWTNVNYADSKLSGGHIEPVLTIEGFKRVQGKFSYSYSLCIFLGNGKEYQKLENLEFSSLDPILKVYLGYRNPPLRDGGSAEILYVNFLIKDKFSNAIIQGSFIQDVNDQKLEEGNTTAINIENNFTRSVNKECEKANTGDYCFTNSTNKSMFVTLYLEKQYTGYSIQVERFKFVDIKWSKEATIKPGQTYCFTNIEAALVTTWIKDDPSFYHCQLNLIENIRVERCKSKTYVIR